LAKATNQQWPPAGSARCAQAKAHRGVLDHLGELAAVELYANDRQIEEVHYRVERGEEVRYTVRLWVLNS
jgi:hypothetical protein